MFVYPQKNVPMTTVGLLSCGESLDTTNPWYHARFESAYQAWWYGKFSKIGCTRSCAINFAAEDLSGDYLPDYVYSCGECVNKVSDATRLESAKQGAGCNLCLDVLAPWAYHTKGATWETTSPLPTVEELQTFLRDENYVPATDAFRALPACERATWAQRVCARGGTTGEPYTIPLRNQVSPSPPIRDPPFFLTSPFGIIMMLGIVFMICLFVYASRPRAVVFKGIHFNNDSKETSRCDSNAVPNAIFRVRGYESTSERRPWYITDNGRWGAEWHPDVQGWQVRLADRLLKKQGDWDNGAFRAKSDATRLEWVENGTWEANVDTGGGPKWVKVPYVGAIPAWFTRVHTQSPAQTST